LIPPQAAHAIYWKCHVKARPSEESFSRPDRANGADVFQSESEAKTAFYAGAQIELTHFEVQAVAVGIIANLCDRTLEK
jgi:hypothetical protein